MNNSRRKSFSGLPLPSSYDEINDKLGEKKSKHINAVHFLQILAQNSENIIKHFDDEKKLDECTTEKVNTTEYTRKSLQRLDLSRD